MAKRLLVRLTAALAFALAASALLGALAAQGGRWSGRLDIAAHFAPVWLWMALAAAGLMLMTPRSRLRSTTRWMAAIAAPLAFLLIAPELLRAGTPAAPQAKADLTVVQFNIWGGYNQDIERALDWVWAQDADIVVMQEVKPRVLASIVRRGGYHVSCEEWFHCFTVVMTRKEPLSAGIPTVRTGRPFSAAAAVATGPGGPIPVIAVHYTHPTETPKQQGQGLRLAAMMDRYPKDRMIVAGDFNSAPWSFTRRREDAAFSIERRTRALATWPTEEPFRGIDLPFPVLPIDHVYAGPAWRTVSVVRGPRLGSDHYPVVVKLARQPKAP